MNYLTFSTSYKRQPQDFSPVTRTRHPPPATPRVPPELATATRQLFFFDRIEAKRCLSWKFRLYDETAERDRSAAMKRRILSPARRDPSPREENRAKSVAVSQHAGQGSWDHSGTMGACVRDRVATGQLARATGQLARAIGEEG